MSDNEFLKASRLADAVMDINWATGYTPNDIVKALHDYGLLCLEECSDVFDVLENRGFAIVKSERDEDSDVAG